MFFLRLRHEIVIGRDARAFLMNGFMTNNQTNGTSWSNATGAGTNNGPKRMPGRMSPLNGAVNMRMGWNAIMQNPSGTGGWIRLPPRLVSGNANSFANCKLNHGSVDCDEDDGVNTSAMGINQGGLCRGPC